MRLHIDDEFITEKIDGHGGNYTYNNYTGRVIIHSIGGICKAKIIWYNIELFLRYLNRKFRVKRWRYDGWG